MTEIKRHYYSPILDLLRLSVYFLLIMNLLLYSMIRHLEYERHKVFWLFSIVTFNFPKKLNSKKFQTLTWTSISWLFRGEKSYWSKIKDKSNPHEPRKESKQLNFLLLSQFLSLLNIS